MTWIHFMAGVGIFFLLWNGGGMFWNMYADYIDRRGRIDRMLNDFEKKNPEGPLERAYRQTWTKL